MPTDTPPRAAPRARVGPLLGPAPRSGARRGGIVVKRLVDKNEEVVVRVKGRMKEALSFITPDLGEIRVSTKGSRGEKKAFFVTFLDTLSMLAAAHRQKVSPGNVVTRWNASNLQKLQSSVNNGH